MEKTNACLKNNELNAVLNTHFRGKVNLARVKPISLFICSLCKVQTVTFDKLANALYGLFRFLAQAHPAFHLGLCPGQGPDRKAGLRPIAAAGKGKADDRPYQLEVRANGHQYLYAGGGYTNG